MNDLTFGFFSFKKRVTPARVPPVPVEHVKPSTRPLVCSQISGPVVSRCARRFAMLSNWLVQTAFGSFSACLRAW